MTRNSGKFPLIPPLRRHDPSLDQCFPFQMKRSNYLVMFQVLGTWTSQPYTSTVSKFKQSLRCQSTSLLHEISTLNSHLSSHQLFITAFRISSLLNSWAGSLSRLATTLTKLLLPKQIFKKILTWRGPLEIDLMAISKNKKLPLYISPHPDPQALALNKLPQG